MYSFRISSATISKFIPEVCQALYEVLKDECLSVSSSEAEWVKIAEQIEAKWQFPHAVGAIDGKHIDIQAPSNTGSQYFNYKKHFSIVLLAIADGNAKFIAFDLGSAGSQSDGGVFKNGSLGKICKSEHFPSKSKLGERVTGFPVLFGVMTHLL